MNTRPATLADVTARAADAFAPSADVRIGAEVEWLVYDRSDVSRQIDAARVTHIAAGQLPAGGTVTIEPGGQVELVTTPHDGPRRLIDAIETDTRALARRFNEHGLALVALGLDPIRDAVRTLDVARYEEMERHFLDVSPAGVRMMNLTASLQLNIDFGPDPLRAWQRANSLAPVLAAAFANSPTVDGADFDPVSQRMRIWAATDPTRTRPVGADPVAWADYVLDALVIAPAHVGRFRDWLDQPTPPMVDDLDRHISTLFPPVRPRGYLEFRMLDALPAPGRAAAIATIWAVMTNDDVGDAACAASRTPAELWRIVHDTGIANVDLHTAVGHILDASAHALRPIDTRLADAVTAWSATPFPAQPDDLAGWLLDSAEPAD